MVGSPPTVMRFPMYVGGVLYPVKVIYESRLCKLFSKQSIAWLGTVRIMGDNLPQGLLQAEVRKMTKWYRLGLLLAIWKLIS